MASGYIDDGYTQPGFIKGVPGFYADLRFTWRPCTSRERREFSRATDNASAEKEERETLRTINKHVLTWDLRDREGDAVDKSESAIGKLHPKLQDRLLLVVLGVAPPDEDPDAPAPAAAVKPAMEQERADVKN